MQSWEDKLIDYLDGHLSQEQRTELEHALAQSSRLRDQLAELQTIVEGLEQAPTFQPTRRLKRNFQQMLDREVTVPASTRRLIPFWSKYKISLQAVAAALLLVLGIFIGMNVRNRQQVVQIENELQTMKKLMITMLDQESVSGRIKAVNISYDIEESDTDIEQALISRMNGDESSNVRLAAVEALQKFADKPLVRDALIQSLAIQSDPVVQIALINILVELKEQKALPYMENLIENDETMDMVKGEAQLGIFKLTSI